MGELGAVGRILIVIGFVLVGFGLVLLVAGKLPGVGRLPGDVYVRRGSFSFYFPITTSIIISVILTVFFRLFARK